MSTFKVAVFSLVVALLMPLTLANAESAGHESGYITGTVSIPGFTTTSLSITAAGGGNIFEKTTYDSSAYQLPVESGDWNYSVSTSCGLNDNDNNAITVSFSQRSIHVAPEATVINDYLSNAGIIRFQVNVSGDPTTSLASAGMWATKTVASGEKTATYLFGTTQKAARSYSWDLPVVPNQQIELTAIIDVTGTSGEVKRYSFGKMAVSPYLLAPRDVSPGAVVVVPIEINFVDGAQPPPTYSYKGYASGNVNLFGLPTNYFSKHTFFNRSLNTNPGSYLSNPINIPANNQALVNLGTPRTYFDSGLDNDPYLRWPHIDGDNSRNSVYVYPDTTTYFDVEREGGILTGSINVSGAVTNEDLKAITLGFGGIGRVYDADSQEWTYLENYYGSSGVKRDTTGIAKRPTERDYQLFLTTGDWEMNNVVLTKQSLSPTRISSVTFTDHTSRFDGDKYFGTPIHIEPGTNQRDFSYCTGSAIFRFKDLNGRLLSNPIVSGKGTHQTNGTVDLTVSNINAYLSESNVLEPEVELFGPAGDYSITRYGQQPMTAQLLTFHQKP